MCKDQRFIGLRRLAAVVLGLPGYGLLLLGCLSFVCAYFLGQYPPDFGRAEFIIFVLATPFSYLASRMWPRRERGDLVPRPTKY